MRRGFKIDCCFERIYFFSKYSAKIKIKYEKGSIFVDIIFWYVKINML